MGAQHQQHEDAVLDTLDDVISSPHSRLWACTAKLIAITRSLRLLLALARLVLACTRPVVSPQVVIAVTAAAAATLRHGNGVYVRMREYSTSACSAQHQSEVCFRGRRRFRERNTMTCCWILLTISQTKASLSVYFKAACVVIRSVS